MILSKKVKSFCLIYFFSLTISIEAYSQEPYKITIDFEQSAVPKEPNYALEANWCALPDMVDMADRVPKGSDLSDMQRSSKADVFFIHPTIFTSKPENEFIWNADLADEKLNQRVDDTAILNQCSAFNGSCKVYAPRYRQAHYSAFTTVDKKSAGKALDLAYKDVKQAFEYYLENYNDGRPIVVASHSQGTFHAKRLLKEFFDGQALQEQLVEAYLIGIAIAPDEFEKISASNSPDDIGGFVTWNTFQEGFYPPYYEDGLNKAICTNPLTWKTDGEYGERKLNSGGVGLGFKFVKEPVDAQVNEGLLWICKPHIKGRMFIKTKIWHRADINLYWMNIRENVALRVSRFVNEHTNYGE